MARTTEQKIGLVAAFYANVQIITVTQRHFRQQFGRHERLPKVVFNDLRHSDDFIRMLGATVHAVLSKMRRCIAIGGRQVESYRF
jgi:hypothetical protein